MSQRHGHRVGVRHPFVAAPFTAERASRYVAASANRRLQLPDRRRDGAGGVVEIPVLEVDGGDVRQEPAPVRDQVQPKRVSGVTYSEASCADSAAASSARSSAATAPWSAAFHAWRSRSISAGAAPWRCSAATYDLGSAGIQRLRSSRNRTRSVVRRSASSRRRCNCSESGWQGPCTSSTHITPVSSRTGTSAASTGSGANPSPRRTPQAPSRRAARICRSRRSTLRVWVRNTPGAGDASW